MRYVLRCDTVVAWSLDRKVAQQRLHDQLNALCPGLSAPAGHGRSLPVGLLDRAGGAGVCGCVRRSTTDESGR